MPSARQLLVQIPSEVPGIEVHHTFPGISHPQQIVAGEDVTTLFTVRNTREQGPVNVTFISGSIANPLNYKVILDNFTVTAYRSRLDAGNEQSFEYTFRVHPAFPSREFRVALTVFYNDMSTYLGHATTFFNQTIEVVEAEQLIDTQLLGLLGYLALALGAIGEPPRLDMHHKLLQSICARPACGDDMCWHVSQPNVSTAVLCVLHSRVQVHLDNLCMSHEWQRQKALLRRLGCLGLGERQNMVQGHAQATCQDSQV